MIPIRTVSEANAHEHWRARQKRAKEQRALAEMVCRSGLPRLALPLRVRLVRIARRDLDSDNLAGSQKHIRDGVADWLGIKDNDPRVEWTYGQERGPQSSGSSTRIEIETLGAEQASGPVGARCGDSAGACP